MELKKNKSSLPDFSWKSSLPLEEISKSKYLHFDIKSLDPGKFSYPYHFHRNAEELFLVVGGEATLRSPKGYETLGKGDIIFFEEGASGAHQLYNHGDDPFVYLDLRTHANVDVCEYPDSGKISILPAVEVFEKTSRVRYYTGEEGVRGRWPEGLVKKKQVPES